MLNPTMLVLSLASTLHEVSAMGLVNLRLKVVSALRLLEGVTVKVLLSSDATGAADIFMQVEKLSEDN